MFCEREREERKIRLGAGVPNSDKSCLTPCSRVA